MKVNKIIYFRGEFRRVEIFSNKQINYARRHASLLWPYESLSVQAVTFTNAHRLLFLFHEKITDRTSEKSDFQFSKPWTLMTSNLKFGKLGTSEFERRHTKKNISINFMELFKSHG